MEPNQLLEKVEQNRFGSTFSKGWLIEVGVEPTKHMQQILSLPPLTTRELNQKNLGTLQFDGFSVAIAICYDVENTPYSLSY